MNCGIYKIVNTSNGKTYIGQSVNIKERVKQHFRSSGNGLLSRSINKYGAALFRVTILVFCKHDDLNYYERAFIVLYDSFGVNGYNLTSGGHDQHTRSEETNNKISCKLKEVWSDPARKAKILSIVQSDEVRAKRTASLRWTYSDPEVLDARSKTMQALIANNAHYKESLLSRLALIRLDKGIEYKRIEGTRLYWSNPDNKAKGLALMQGARTKSVEDTRKDSIRDYWKSDRSLELRKFHSVRMKDIYANPELREVYLLRVKASLTEEIIEKRSNSIRLYWDNIPDEARETNKRQLLAEVDKLRISVLCNETGEVFESMAEAGRWLIVSGKVKSNCGPKISECCSGKRKSAGGYTWCYAS